MSTKMTLSVLLISSLFVVSCATKKHKAMMPSTEAKQVAMEEEASHVTEFSFRRGSAELTEVAKQDLRQVISDAQRSGHIKELKVITWGDAEYPSAQAKKLSPDERDLVKKRNTAISDYVKNNYQGIDVDTYSMAERPGTLKEMMNTSDARVKKSLEAAEAKAPKKSSKSIVMIITE